MLNTPNAGQLLKYLRDTYALKSDKALATFLGLPPPVVSNLRAGRLTFGPTYIIQLHEETSMPIKLIKSMLPAPVSK